MASLGASERYLFLSFELFPEKLPENPTPAERKAIDRAALFTNDQSGYFRTRYSARQRPGLRRCGPTFSTGMRSTRVGTSPRLSSQSSSPRSCGRPSGHGEVRNL